MAVRELGGIEDRRAFPGLLVIHLQAQLTGQDKPVVIVVQDVGNREKLRSGGPDDAGVSKQVDAGFRPDPQTTVRVRAEREDPVGRQGGGVALEILLVGRAVEAVEAAAGADPQVTVAPFRQCRQRRIGQFGTDRRRPDTGPGEGRDGQKEGKGQQQFFHAGRLSDKRLNSRFLQI